VILAAVAAWINSLPSVYVRLIERFGTSEARLALARLLKPQGREELA